MALPDGLITGRTAKLPTDYRPQPADRPRKFGNRKVQADGFLFDSKAEHARYEDLKLFQQAGLIYNLEVHPKFVLREKILRPNKPTIRAITYVADFSYFEMYANDRVFVVEDVKGGPETAAFRLKAKLFEAAFPDYDLRIVRGK